MNRSILKKYLKYGFDNRKIESIIIKNNFKTDETFIKKEIEKQIIDEIRKDNIDTEILLIDDYSYIKSQITKNKKYDIDKSLIDKIYEEAIEMLKENYDDSKYLSINILNNMKNIITKKSLNNNRSSDEIYDISFLYEYVIYFKDDKEEYLNTLSMIMDIQKNRLYELIKGIKKANSSELFSLLTYFKVDTYEKLIDEIKLLEKSELKTKKATSNLRIMTNDITTDNIVKSIDKMSDNELLEVLKVHQMNYKDALVSILYFGGVIDKSLEEISEILNVDENEINSLIEKDKKIIKSYKGE